MLSLKAAKPSSFVDRLPASGEEAAVVLEDGHPRSLVLNQTNPAIAILDCGVLAVAEFEKRRVHIREMGEPL
jgi:hypothetical protein